jgi:CheY-like chemotaxis protein
LAGTIYNFNGLSQPEKALETAFEVSPHLIVMDVMMPGLDDWELLGRLRTHPITREIPIVVCTILPQEQLALTLGATEFLRKPVNRQEFLAGLERCLAVHSAQKRK